jgi:hypothetical protein
VIFGDLAKKVKNGDFWESEEMVKMTDLSKWQKCAKMSKTMIFWQYVEMGGIVAFSYFSHYEKCGNVIFCRIYMLKMWFRSS